MKKFCLLVYTFCLITGVARSQYAPQAGLPGSTAINYKSSVFTGWATNCTVQRGFMNIADPSLGYASDGYDSLGIGPADGKTVSLGDSGVADLTFEFPIYNGPGADFAVFENGFLNSTNDSLAFLELGFVEVSSDGVNYFRFPATSLTQDSVQINNDDYIYANNLNNLAGSYIALYGTPFDLQDVSGIVGLDINNITHVRVIDVVGSINGHSSHDSAGRIINDPYPTPFPSCGFDLDAVGVINALGNEGVINIGENVSIKTYPNPVTDRLIIAVKGDVPDGLTATLTDITGKPILQNSIARNRNEMSVSQLSAGMYYLELVDANGNKWVEKIIKR